MLSHSQVVESAKADGNCAFNAFVLGFCDPAVLDNLLPPDNAPFVIEASRRLSVVPATWQALKAALLQKEREELQRVLAPLMREIAIQMLSHPSAPLEQKSIHLEGTTAAIQTELEQYFNERNTKKPDAVDTRKIGDIFIRHPFIKAQFEALYQSQQNKVDAAQRDLVQWWKKAGHAEFLKEMKQSAKSASDTNLYAGDLELAPLGAYFGVNVRVRSPQRGFAVQLHHANGRLPDALQGHARALADRNIIDNNGHHWVDLSEADVEQRLSAVPQHDAVLQFFRTKKPQRGARVSSTNNQALIEQLCVRGVLNSKGTFNMVDVNDVASRIGEFPDKAVILEARKNTYCVKPVITLENQSAVHWNNVKSISAPKVSPTKKSYIASEPEKDVNAAMNEVLDLLEANRSKLSDRAVQKHFETTFAAFQEDVKAYNPVLFQQKKQAVLQSIQDELTAVVPVRASV